MHGVELVVGRWSILDEAQIAGTSPWWSQLGFPVTIDRESVPDEMSLKWERLMDAVGKR